jgi:hypothetical protein
MKKLEDIELKIENENEDGCFAISLVDRPAIQENFIALSEHKIELKVVDEDKRILVGLALVPNKKIYRNVNGKEFNVFFSEQTIEKTNELFMRNLNLNSITSQHETKVSGVSVIESWIVEDEKNDKANLYNLNAIKGSWVVKMKVYNDEEWNKVKLGEYKGFSIEGIFQGLDKLQASEQEVEEEDLTTDIIEFLKSV